MDATSATIAYLSTIPPAQALLAKEYTQGGHWLLLWGKSMTVLVALLIGRSRFLRTIGEPGPDRPFGRPFKGALAFLAAFFVLELPWSAYTGWYRERSYGFAHQSLPGWLAEYLIQSSITAAVGAVLLAAFFMLTRRTGRGWWLWGAGLASLGLVLALIVQPILLGPVLNRYRPAPAGPVRDATDALLRSGGVPKGRVFVYDGSKQSDRYTASVTGLGRTPTVGLSDAMFRKGADVAQVRAVVAHELGHQRHLHLVLLAAFMTLLVAAGLLIAEMSFEWVARATGNSSGISTPGGLSTLFVIFSCYSLLTTPLVNTVERTIEADADGYGLELAREPDGMARALLASSDYRASSPSVVEEAVFYDHPSVRSRIYKAMQWKTGHAAAPR